MRTARNAWHCVANVATVFWIRRYHDAPTGRRTGFCGVTRFVYQCEIRRRVARRNFFFPLPALRVVSFQRGQGFIQVEKCVGQSSVCRVHCA
jgi:hypothetical protein